MGVDKVNQIKKVLNYRLPSGLSNKGVKVKSLLIFVMIGLIITPLLTSYDNQGLVSIAISEDGSMCAYVTDGDYMPSALCVSESNGTLLFKHVFSSEETGGGDVIVWFVEEKIYVYALRSDMLMMFSKDGTIESTEKIIDYDYPDYYKGFKKGFSTYSCKTKNGEYRYTNVDIFNSFVLRRSRELIFVDNQGNTFIIWNCLNTME